MTCQCTCGKHILIDTSKSVTMANPAANAAAGGAAIGRMFVAGGGPITIFNNDPHLNAAAAVPLSAWTTVDIS